MASDGNSKKSTKNTLSGPAGATSKDVETESKVLFQKIFDKWYAFSTVEDDCFIAEVPQQEVLKRLKLMQTN